MLKFTGLSHIASLALGSHSVAPGKAASGRPPSRHWSVGSVIILMFIYTSMILPLIMSFQCTARCAVTSEMDKQRPPCDVARLAVLVTSTRSGSAPTPSLGVYVKYGSLGCIVAKYMSVYSIYHCVQYLLTLIMFVNVDTHGSAVISSITNRIESYNYYLPSEICGMQPKLDDYISNTPMLKCDYEYVDICSSEFTLQYCKYNSKGRTLHIEYGRSQVGETRGCPYEFRTSIDTEIKLKHTYMISRNLYTVWWQSMICVDFEVVEKHTYLILCNPCNICYHFRTTVHSYTWTAHREHLPILPGKPTRPTDTRTKQELYTIEWDTLRVILSANDFGYVGAYKHHACDSTTATYAVCITYLRVWSPYVGYNPVYFVVVYCLGSTIYTVSSIDVCAWTGYSGYLLCLTTGGHGYIFSMGLVLYRFHLYIWTLCRAYAFVGWLAMDEMICNTETIRERGSSMGARLWSIFTR